MSFSSQVKTELASIENYSACCSKAQVYGLVLFAHFSSYDVSVTTENQAVLQAYISAIESICSCKPSITQKAAKKVDAFVESKDCRNTVFDYFGHTAGAATTRINRANITDDCCYAAFLRGAFLACGTVTDPRKNYHLEFVVSHKKLCLDLMKLMEELSLTPKYIMRKGNHIIYFKDSESIEDVLTVIGASNAALEIMGIKIEKDVKNSVNRKLNFEMSNLSKTVNASTVQMAAIKKIISKHNVGWLPPNLREIAVLRIENPDVTLKELGEMLSVPLSRSGVNHRLKKLIEIAESIED